MDDPLRVRGFERVGDLRRDRQGFVDRQRTARNPIRQRGPFDEFEHQGLHAVGLLHSVDGRDVGMVERREQPRFAGKPGEPLRIARNGSGRILSATKRERVRSLAR